MADSAISFLLDQLAVVLRDEQKLIGGLKLEVESMKAELTNLRQFLRVADAQEETDSTFNDWVVQLREISLDVQDVLDQYMLRFGQQRGSHRGLLKKVGDAIKNLKAQHQIASEIKAINHKLENVIKSQQRYRGMYATMGSTTTEVERYDGRGDALFLEEDEVLGIEKPKKQIVKWIGSVDSGLDVISVVGMGGLGKTTLAKKVYDDESVKSYFDQHVWLVVSDYKDVKHLLINLVKKLMGEIKEPPPQGLEDMSIDDVRNFIHEFLKGKKYIIVLDDIWNLSIWEAVKCAFARKESRGCVIITTRSNNIGDAACSETNHVYHLMPLSTHESRVLFFRMAFPRSPCPPYLREFADNILRRCEGLPLAIVVIGGVLARKKHTIEEWGLFNRSLGQELKANSLERLWKLFSLSYNDLPYYLKYCFLYLSVFLEGGLLEKERILRLWIAEGFVQSEQDKTMEEVAEQYLDELCSRSLIQVAEKHIDGRAKRFRIHDLMRDYIASEAREHNIVTIYKGDDEHWPYKMRRLAIQNSLNFSLEANSFEHLRSLLLSNGDIEIATVKKIVSRCRLLKVLDLRGAPLDAIPDEIFRLYHLRYLCLRGTKVKLVPKSIKYLQNLETLDLKNTNVTKLPKEILTLQRLRHLLVYKYTIEDPYKIVFGYRESFSIPYDIGNCLRSPQKLCYVNADEVGSNNIVREIGKLTQLRRLGIVKLRREHGKDLCSSIAKLTSLRSLVIASTGEGETLEIDSSVSSIELPFLRTLSLYGRLEKMPQWISSLHGLSILQIAWSKLKEDPLSCLEDLPNLAFLLIKDAHVEGLHFKAHGFAKLKNMRSAQGVEHLTNLEYVGFHDMPSEFKDMVVEEQRSQGDSWRLARVRHVGFGIKRNGTREYSNIVDK